MELEQAKWEAFDQSRRVFRKLNLGAGMDFSTPLKVLSFLSRQRHHMRQWGIIFQTFPASELPSIPFQQVSRSTTLLGITQNVTSITLQLTSDSPMKNLRVNHDSIENYLKITSYMEKHGFFFLGTGRNQTTKMPLSYSSIGTSFSHYNWFGGWSYWFKTH